MTCLKNASWDPILSARHRQPSTLAHKKGLAGLEVQSMMGTDRGIVRVPAGSFKGSVKGSSEVSCMGKKFRSDSWFYPAVPINGMVKSVSDNGETKIMLLDFGLSGSKGVFRALLEVRLFSLAESVAEHPR